MRRSEDDVEWHSSGTPGEVTLTAAGATLRSAIRWKTQMERKLTNSALPGKAVQPHVMDVIVLRRCNGRNLDYPVRYIRVFCT